MISIPWFSPRFPPVQLAAASIVALLVLTSCANQATPAPSQGWHTKGLYAFSAIVKAKDRFVFLAHRTPVENEEPKPTQGPPIQVVGLDSNTGKQKWAHDVSTSGIEQDTHAFMVDSKNKTVFVLLAVGAMDDSRVNLAAFDTTSGKQRWRNTQTLDLTEGLQLCEIDDYSTLCAAGSIDGGPIDLITMDTTDGTAKSGGVDRAHMLVTGFYERGEGAKEEWGKPLTIERRTPQKLLWRKTTVELFDTPMQFHSQYMYGINQDPYIFTLSAGTAEGEIAQFEEGASEPHMFELHLDTYRTVGVNAKTGDVLWTDLGSQTGCNGLLLRSNAVDLRCRYFGVVHIPKDEDAEPDLSQLTVTVERYNPATGKTVWGWDAGHMPSLFKPTDDTTPRWISPTSVALTHDDGKTTVLNTLSGEIEKPSKNSGGWCTTENMFAGAIPHGDREYLNWGQEFSYPCTLEGKRSKTPSWLPDTSLGQMGAWSDVDGIHATRSTIFT